MEEQNWSCRSCGTGYKDELDACPRCGDVVRQPLVNYSEMPDLDEDELPDSCTAIWLGCYVDCVYYRTERYFDDVFREYGYRMRCDRYPDRENCWGCKVCPKCGAPPANVAAYETYKECLLCGGYFVLPFPGGVIPAREE